MLFTLLFEANLDVNFEPLLQGFKRRSHKDTVALLKELRPVMMSVGNKMAKGDSEAVDDWITDFVAEQLPKVVDVALKNMKSGRYKLGQFPALVSASFRRFALNKIRDAKLRKTRETQAGLSRGVAHDPSSRVARSDQIKIANIVRKYIQKEKDPEVRDFLMHLTGLSDSRTLTFDKISGGDVKDALKSAGLDPDQWQKTGRASKAKSRLFKSLAQDRTLRRFVGVESKTLYGPGLLEVTKTACPSYLEGCQYLGVVEDAFFEWLLGVLHG